MTSWLKKATIASQAPKTGVIDILRANIGGYQKARSHKVTHASDTTKGTFCPRHVALLLSLEQDKKDEYTGTALEATFAMGRVTAKTLVEEWMGQKAIGNWECCRCGVQVSMQAKPHASVDCPSKWGKHRWEYVEPNFVSTEFGVSGSIDVLADMGPKWSVVELKIMKAEDWDALLTPLPEHRHRTAMYLQLIADSDSKYKDMINLHEGRILYVSRGYGKKHPAYGDILPFKEFVVTRDDEAVRPYLLKGKAIKIFKETGKMPAGICKTALDKPAKGCTTCTACFSGAYPVTQEVLV